LIQRSFKEIKPTLYVVSTPIGNLSDITYRAIEILSSVDAILCEDTRTSAVLLNHYQIKKPLISYHEFNKFEKEDQILSMLSEGKNLALISDAGTPGINDPGYEIIKKVIDSNFHVVSIPGASAILASLVVSGLVIQPFTFIGFLPKKASDQKKLLTSYQERPETLIIYESPMRMSTTIKTLFSIYGNRQVVLARELTKTFETIIRTNLNDAQTIEHNTKGEYVIILEGYIQKEVRSDLPVQDEVKKLIRTGMSEKDAIKTVAKTRKLPKNDVYKTIKMK
jgi:16S rRNA (cytidine1402-2'-O)-methyltransferase